MTWWQEGYNPHENIWRWTYLFFDEFASTGHAQTTAATPDRSTELRHWNIKLAGSFTEDDKHSRTFFLNYNSFFKIRISGITDDFILTFVSNLLFKYTTSFCVTSEILLSTTLKQTWRIGCIDAWHPDSFIATIRLDNRSEMMSASQFDAVNWCVSCLTTASHVSLTISAKTYFNHSSMCQATDTCMHASGPAPPTKNQSNDSGTLLPLEPGNSLGVPKSQITSSTGTWLHGILISNSSSVPFKTVFLSFIFFPVKSDMYFIKACYDISTINTLWVFGYLCWLLFFKFGYSSLWSTISSIWIFILHDVSTSDSVMASLWAGSILKGR